VDMKFGTQNVKIMLTGNSCKTISKVYVQFNERREVRWDNHNTKLANGILFFLWKWELSISAFLHTGIIKRNGRVC